jgi:hypothetical protein
MRAELSHQQRRELADELSILSRQQSHALRLADCDNMSPEESQRYNQRAARIEEIRAFLGHN